ncbi:L domain-like protein [Ramicandelaber brevisporus]|nr:L domain-like protein [Ramicandelaber brevisporus]
MRSYIAEQRRLQRERGSGTASSALADPHTIPVEVLRTARTSGVLNLSLRQLKFVPDSVYAMYEPANRAPGENWWDQVDLTLIDLSNNEIGGIDGVKFGELAPRLKTLKLDSNEIGELPDSAVEKMIETLEVVSVSNNKLTSLPQSLWKASNLKQLEVQKNNLTSFPSSNAVNITGLSRLVISDNPIGELPDDISSAFPSLSILQSARCKLARLPLSMSKLGKLVELDVSGNALKYLFEPSASSESVIAFPKLALLNADNNAILNIIKDGAELELELPSLVTLSLAANRLSSVDIIVKACSATLLTLNVSSNSISSIDSLGDTLNLKHINLASNQLRNVPNSLVKISRRIERLQLEHNPLHPPVNDQKSTDALLARLRAELNDKSEDNSNNSSGGQLEAGMAALSTNDNNNGSSSNSGYSRTNPSTAEFCKDATVNTAKGIVSLVRKDYSTLSPESFNASLVGFDVTNLDVSNNKLGHSGGDILQTTAAIASFSSNVVNLTLAGNGITSATLPFGSEAVFAHLKILNLSNDALKSLNPFFALQSSAEAVIFPALEELNMTRNKMNHLIDTDNSSTSSSSPLQLRSIFPRLQVLNVSCNQISELIPISQASIEDADVTLAHLLAGIRNIDISDNSISRLPPVLGVVSGLKDLNVIGNTFRVPRYDIVSRGSEAILKWLSERVDSSTIQRISS